MLDVRHRARLRHRRRVGAMVGSMALVTAGGVAAVVAQGKGDPGTSTGPATDGTPTFLPTTSAVFCAPVTTAILPTTTLPPQQGTDVSFVGTTTTTFPVTDATLPPCSPVTGVWACSGPLGNDGVGHDLYTDCVPREDAVGPQSTVPANVGEPGVVSTTAPVPTFVPTTIAVGGTYIVQQGDSAANVALKFDVTLAELNAANVDTPGYSSFFAGLTIEIPPSHTIQATTTTAVAG